MAQIFAGTSGFAYAGWKPTFYPQKLASGKFLEHYATRLNSVEINYTFRRLPSASSLESWVNATPDGFVFALKAHQRITHILRLKEAASFTELFFKAIDPLRSARRLGPVLFQLPPNMKCDTAVLAAFLPLLPEDIRVTFEFRNTSWFNDDVYRMLQDRNISLCLAESEKLEVPKVLTADFVYSRLRKPEYSDAERADILAEARRIVAQGKDLFVYFKHEESPQGALYSEELLQKDRESQ